MTAFAFSVPGCAAQDGAKKMIDIIIEDKDYTGIDFKTSYNYSIDPEVNSIKKAKFSLEGISGLLYKYDIVIE